eukprot:TRINITY_DN791_c0_g2_i1.p1 TRINITY_DN791_c0_g2~~TRINITY_DN791_c0_g2_i1.p1  ORF type:complete len:109 (-),score=5.40 TRINITY_DN791_c0_g2_i1:257-583(-)
MQMSANNALLEKSNLPSRTTFGYCITLEEKRESPFLTRSNVKPIHRLNMEDVPEPTVIPHSYPPPLSSVLLKPFFEGHQRSSQLTRIFVSSVWLSQRNPFHGFPSVGI